MTLDPAWLHGTLRSLESTSARPARYVLALSGGLDSTVLLHLLAGTRGMHDVPITAVHVDHGLHDESGRWAEAASEVAASLGVSCRIVRVDVGRDGGPEAAARDARYAALAALLQEGDWLLSAHHRNDQAETLLLNLMRGSGPEGLAAMPASRPFGRGRLVRPLLSVTRDVLQAYAEAESLSWTDDPSNADTAFDRNFLRRDVLPALSRRWPDSIARIAQSAAHLGDVGELLQEVADADLAAMSAAPGRVTVSRLLTLGRERRAQVLRRAAERAGVPKPTARALREIVSSLLDAREDALPVVQWSGAECRRYRDTLYLAPAFPDPTFDGLPLTAAAPAELGAGFGTLALAMHPTAGLDPARVAAGLVLRRRKGGEEIRPYGQRHTRKLKKLLQERGVLPWRRDALPLVYAGDALVAVGDLWIAADAIAEPGYALRWRDAPAYLEAPVDGPP